MKRYHDDSECYILFGKEINQIIAMLGILSERNPDVENLSEFIDKLKTMRSYDDMLDEMIMSTRVEDMSKREREDEGLSLNEILNKSFRLTVSNAGVRSVDKKGSFDDFIKSTRAKNLSMRLKKVKKFIINKSA